MYITLLFANFESNSPGYWVASVIRSETLSLFLVEKFVVVAAVVLFAQKFSFNIIVIIFFHFVVLFLKHLFPRSSN